MNSTARDLSFSSKAHGGLQPKFKDCALDKAATPEELRPWTRLISGIIRNIEFGDELEDFLDYYTGRTQADLATRPAFLERPELALGEGAFSAGSISRASRGRTLGSQDSVSEGRTASVDSPARDPEDPMPQWIEDESPRSHTKHWANPLQ